MIIKRNLLLAYLPWLMTFFLPACSSNKLPPPKWCTSDDQCAANETCYHNLCRPKCVLSSDCPNGEECISGVCLKPCQQDADCPSGQECISGYCQPKPPQDGGDGDAGADGDGGGGCEDYDGDGYGPNCPLGNDDCDDHERTIHPGAMEACNDGRDNDCDGQTDESDCGCEPGTNTACYEGPFGTGGVGECRAGIAVCQADRSYGECVGQKLPEEEVCDGRDNNCDGRVDEGLLNACGGCGPVPEEICGNGFDDNCNGQTDENCVGGCDPNCQCEGPGAGQQCVCHPPENQPCYSGPPATLGIGQCRGGVHDCVQQGNDWVWTACEGEKLPGEECAGGVADGIDNDCDGEVDEGCLDRDNDGYSPPQDCDDNDAEVHPGVVEVCDGKDNNCDGLVDDGVTNRCGGCGAVPEEACMNGLDDDCDGEVDEGCGGCSGGQVRQCYRGPDGTQGVGQCKWGEMYCDGEFWSECEGDVIPQPEVCDGVDNDCDGEADERWALGSNACGWCSSEELCDGVDNDCDGQVDEGLRNYCGQCIFCASNDDCGSGTECNLATHRCRETACDGQDNNCDGLIDEGLINACGTCGESCYEQDWSGQDDWPYGESDGVSNSADPDELRLDSTTQAPHFIWIAGTNVVCSSTSDPPCLTNPPCYSGTDCHTVRKFDTRTNQLIGVYSSWGWSPSRTAVAVDNSVWVGNRGCHDNLSNCEATNKQHGNAVHLDADGNLICRANVTGSGVAVRAVTIDKDGNAWLGSWGDAKIYKYSGSELEPNPDTDGTPLCRRLLEVDLQGSRAYGAAVDGNGYLWISTIGNGPLRKINTATGEIVMSVSPGANTYGIAIDQQNNVWLGNWSGGTTGVVKVDGQTGAVTLVPRTVGNTSNGQTRGVAVDHQNNIWVAEWNHHTVSKYDANGNHLLQVSLGSGASGPLGMAVDFDNNIWAIAYSSGHASKFDLNGNHLATFSVGGNPYTYSDMTGYQLRTITLKHGTWTVDYDSGYENAQWDTIEWSGSLANDDRLAVRARTAATRGALATATWSPYHEADPAQPSPWRASIASEVPRGRWIQVQVTLETQDEISPVFTGLQVFWQR